MANILQLIGLVLDLIGVFIMAFDLIFIDKRLGTVEWLENVKEIAEEAKIKVWRGLFFIGLGFLFQCTGTVINICHSMH